MGRSLRDRFDDSRWKGHRTRLVLQNDVSGASVSIDSVACAEHRHLQRMNDTRDVTQDGQQDVDEEVGIAATL